VWSDKRGLKEVLEKFGYCFIQPPGSGYPPILNAREIPEPFTPFAIGGPGGDVPIQPFGVMHGGMRALGFRFGPVAYTPDVSALDEAARTALAGLDCWILDALRYTPHPSHANLEQALGWIAELKPRRAILTNMHVDLDYEKLKHELPPGIEPGYDGMTIRFDY
jgi:phosphoribosyl 1,2-cyclic phosphate phosphodiesterase